MRLSDQLHCPDCKSCLSVLATDELRCPGCGRTVPLIDGIADLAGPERPLPVGADDYHGAMPWPAVDAADLLTLIKLAAGDRWPTSLGAVIEFGCGDTTYALAATETFRGLLVLDSAIEALQACRHHIATLDRSPRPSVAFATLSGAQDAIRDAVANTIIGTGLLSNIANVRAFLAMVHRALRPGGQAAFVVPNWRYHQAMCLAMAEALVQQHACDGVWPEGHQAVLTVLAETRPLLLHSGAPGSLTGSPVKHVFESEALQDLSLEVGFATAEMIPLEPDPFGAKTLRRICEAAGASKSFADAFSARSATAGQAFFKLLNRQDSSAAALLWLTKARGPEVRIFTHQSLPSDQPEASAALGGIAPRWSIELLARDTPEGLTVTMGGWCLCNTDVQWVRLTLNGVIRDAAVSRPRPDVHEVLNKDRLYNPLNTLCSGVAGEMLFDGVHLDCDSCPVQLEIVLTSGIVVSRPTPEPLILNEQMVIAH